MVAFVMLWLGMTTGFYSLLSKGDDVVRETSKRHLARMLQKTQLTRMGKRGLRSFLMLFDGIFGSRHLSWKCFRRTSLVSLIFIIIVASWQEISSVRDLLFLIPLSLYYFSAGVVTNLILDYLSLLKTRWILGRMVLTRNVVLLGGLVILDFVATTAAAVVAIYLALWWNPDFSLCPHDLLTGNESGITTSTFSPLLVSETIKGNTAATAFCYSTLLTSFWVLIYGLSTILVRFVLTRMDQLANGFLKLVDVNKHPFKAIALASNVILTVFFMVGAIIKIVF